MAFDQSFPLLDKLSSFKRKLKDRSKAKAEKKGLRRGWIKEPHADVHSGVNSDAFRAGYDLIFGKDKWAQAEEQE